MFDFFKKKKKVTYDVTNLSLKDLDVGFIFDYDMKSWVVQEAYKYDWCNNNFVNDILENIKSLQLSPSVLEELVQKHYVENKKIVSLEGNLLRLAMDHKIPRNEFIKFYVGNEINPNLKSFVASKKVVSMILLPILIITSLISVYDWAYGLLYLKTTTDINAIFYNEFFTILILADVLILLLSFQYTERYSQLIRNTGFVICTILIRLSFGVSGLTNVLLIISSVAFGLLILTIYNMEENPSHKKVNTD